MRVLYTANATATGDGRNGQVTTSDGLLNHNLAIPTAMGGPGGATNPEQLFAAGYAACFHSALQTVARKTKTDLGTTAVSAEVGIGPTDGGFGLTAALTISAPDLDPETAERLVAQAHQVCPYSNATRGNIDVTLTITKETPA